MAKTMSSLSPAFRVFAAPRVLTATVAQCCCVLSLIVATTCTRPIQPSGAPAIDCRVYPPQATSPYVLPWDVGASHLVINTTGHYRAENGGVGLYAIDFAMPIGTGVDAVRAGRVIATQAQFADTDPVDPHYNFVFVRQDDGTMARYIHLAQNGVLVAVGIDVQQGDPIGLSGSSGTSQPHLHFDVQQCCCNLLPDTNALPCGQTLPLTFRNTKAESCGLRVGVSYEALPPTATQVASHVTVSR
jgi:murein DD-endopeptidase MepM/ murein hydrolase activator NlpD